MPQTEIVFYREAGGEAPVLDWLKGLRRSDRKAYEGGIAAIERLAQFGQTKEDKIPEADLERALRRKKAFEADRAAHSYYEEA